MTFRGIRMDYDEPDYNCDCEHAKEEKKLLSKIFALRNKFAIKLDDE